MAGTPPWLLGKHLTAVSLTGLTVASDGTFSVGSTQNILAYIGEVDTTEDHELEDVRPVWSLLRKMVETGNGNSLRLTVLQKSNASNLITALLASGYRHFLAAWTQGTETFTGYYIVARWNSGVKNRGANPQTLELEPVDATVSQFVVS